ncbi:MAG: LEA type 2 family protein [Bacteroidota bacterium]
MKKNRTAIWIFFLLLGAALIGGILYYVLRPKEAAQLILPEIKEISYIYADIKDDQVAAKLYAIVQNQNPYSLVLDTIHFEFKLDGMEMIKETIPIQLKQSQYELDTVKLPIRFNLKKIIEKIVKIQNKDSIDFEMDGYIIYNTIIGQQKLKKNKKIRIAVPVPPKIKIKDVEHSKFKIGDKTSEANIKLEIINRGKYVDMKLKDINYYLRIPNTITSKGIIKNAIIIKPGVDQVVDIPVMVEYDHPIKTALAIIFDNDQVPYELTLRCDLKVNNLKDLNIIPMEVHATGTTELKEKK